MTHEDFHNSYTNYKISNCKNSKSSKSPKNPKNQESQEKPPKIFYYFKKSQDFQQEDFKCNFLILDIHLVLFGVKDFLTLELL